ncbi:YqaE/Pmp3 family membrane protein [Halomonas sp. FeN2]|uniref:YqaE/Pmp3 family membrane protein n=1 Tax=Halomonadaceae TaxID=28256 RepID=UPI000C51A341|nr:MULTISPECIES: YqaE/Pmp3 family membrane protein [unclassified Halomonas]MBF59971.1 YqaE/Pmp3 family membrane protein [Halomonas sp.]UBR50443.1 YqaE/Pmp3 family membrane protein [Halomonas sp. FeN2]|tara:strand:- start:983 stop:1519 length:537 start_codon:yes stop_codon:yes gene_type:complete
MDAREYLNRKGVGLDRDPDRPNTLEEKAWERARGSGHQRPKSGTPHDWEDWERHHDDLAEGAETLEQKIDKEAHRVAQERAAKAAAEPASSSVEHFTPPTKVEPAPAEATPPKATPVKQAAPEPEALKLAYYALALLLPPLAVGLTDGGSKRVGVALLLTLAGWLPGVVYAFWWLQRR